LPILPKVLSVAAHAVVASDLHSARQPPHHSAALVVRKVVPGKGVQQTKDLRKAFLRVFFVELAQSVLAANDLGDALDEVGNGCDKIDHAGRNRASRHRRVFGFLRVLHEDDAACLLHGANAECAI
jgi:hypothetical protein